MEPKRDAAETPEPEIRDIEARLRAWFPTPCFVKAARIGDYPVLPEEYGLVARAVARRRQEFATGRWLCRQGLRSLGYPDAPIYVGPLRNPLLPSGAAGAVTHDGDLCVVVLKRQAAGRTSAFGVDVVARGRGLGTLAEIEPLLLASGNELAAMSSFRLAVEPGLLLFSLKESIVKAISARVGAFLDLRAIEIRDSGCVTYEDRPLEAKIHAFATPHFLVTAACVA